MTEKENLTDFPDGDMLTPSVLSNPQELLNNLNLLVSQEEDWTVTNQTIIVIRSLAQFHSRLLTSYPPKGLLPFLLRHSNSLRSGISRNALFGFEDVFLNCSDLECLNDETVMTRVVSLLALKCSNDKKFLAEAANRGLEALIKIQRLIKPNFELLLDCAKTTKNTKMTVIATEFACNCLMTLTDEKLSLISDIDIEKTFKIVLDLEAGKSVGARTFAQRIIQTLNKVFVNEMRYQLVLQQLSSLQQSRLKDILNLENKQRKTESTLAEKPWLAKNNNPKTTV